MESRDQQRPAPVSRRQICPKFSAIRTGECPRSESAAGARTAPFPPHRRFNDAGRADRMDDFRIDRSFASSPASRMRTWCARQASPQATV